MATELNFVLQAFHLLKQNYGINNLPCTCICNLKPTTELNNSVITQIKVISSRALKATLVEVPYVGIMSVYSNRIKKWLCLISYFNEKQAKIQNVILCAKTTQSDLDSYLSSLNILTKISRHVQIGVRHIKQSMICNGGNFLNKDFCHTDTDVRTKLCIAFKKAISKIDYPIETILTILFKNRNKLEIPGDANIYNKYKENSMFKGLTAYMLWATGFPNDVLKYMPTCLEKARRESWFFYPWLKSNRFIFYLLYITDFFSLIQFVAVKYESELHAIRNLNNLLIILNYYCKEDVLPPLMDKYLSTYSEVYDENVKATIKDFLQTFIDEFSNVPNMKHFDFVHNLYALNDKTVLNAVSDIASPYVLNHFERAMIMAESQILEMGMSHASQALSFRIWPFITSKGKFRHIKQAVHFGLSCGMYNKATEDLVRKTEDMYLYFKETHEEDFSRIEDLEILINLQMSCEEFKVAYENFMTEQNSKV